MTLDEAIIHCQEKSCSDTECAKEHKQLGEWLVELKQRREQEKPVSEGLEVELEKYIKDHFTIDKEQLDRFGIEVKDYMYSMDKSDMLAMVHHFVGKHQEPVSEDLEKEIDNYVKKNGYDGLDSIEEVKYIAYHFANWQKEQFEKNRLKQCNSITNEQAELEQGFIDQHIDKYNRMPTFLDAIEYGMRLQKEQMMTNAIDVEVKVDAGGYPYIPQMELYDYDKDVPLAKEGDKYNVVLINEG